MARAWERCAWLTRSGQSTLRVPVGELLLVHLQEVRVAEVVFLVVQRAQSVVQLGLELLLHVRDDFGRKLLQAPQVLVDVAQQRHQLLLLGVELEALGHCEQALARARAEPRVEPQVVEHQHVVVGGGGGPVQEDGLAHEVAVLLAHPLDLAEVCVLVEHVVDSFLEYVFLHRLFLLRLSALGPELVSPPKPLCLPAGRRPFR